MVIALCLMTGYADGLQGHIIVGVTCNASHQAVGVHGMAFGVTSG